MIKLSQSIISDTNQDADEQIDEMVSDLSELVKRALGQHFQFSSKKFDELHISIKFSEDGTASLTLS